MKVGLWILWVRQNVIHIVVLKRDALRLDLLEIKCAQNRFVMTLCVYDEVVYGGDASVADDGIQRATWDGDRFKLEIGIAFLEVELVDVAIGCRCHLV